MRRTRIAEVLSTDRIGQTVNVKGWVRFFRQGRFLLLNDGSTLHNVQAVVDQEHFDEARIKKLTTGAAVSVTGEVVASAGTGQVVEILVTDFTILGEAQPSEVQRTILQPKTHTLETLREQAHLRFRTSTFGAVFRIRHALAFAVHQYFNDRGYFNIHTPIVTASDAEGAGEMFQVTTLPLDRLPRTPDGLIDYGEDFFGKKTSLTVSGQLEAELAALALGQVYTFGPTFRAENSNTSRHLAEFWMIEPEVAFNDLQDNMDLGEDFLRYCVHYATVHCADDLNFLHQREVKAEAQLLKDQRNEMPLLERLAFVVDNEFARLTYTEAIDVLRDSRPYKKEKFTYPVEWGTDLQSEHERYLVEKHFKRPVILVDYPAKTKAFYMRLNQPDDQGRETVAAMDILFPGVGEIMGGSQREERLDVLRQRCDAFDIPAEEMWWYLDTRRFGTAVHSGFGLGFERLVMFVTGMGNIRDVIPFPRAPKSADF
ncbi:MAG: asparagine--tRNA ligase [Acidobacteria bacterium]|nr:asparagine--tRNA ligase [Acidobacteriota bacterium]